MKKILFANGTQTFDPTGKNFSTQANKSYRSIKSYIKGSWYSEITHIEGDSFQLFGIACDCGSIVYYPEGYRHDSLITVEGCLSDDTYLRVPTPISIPNQTTVGVLFNLDRHLFSIFYNTSFYTYEFKQPHENTKYNIIFGGGNYMDMHDVISLNFGNDPFEINIPSIALIPGIIECQSTISKPLLSNINPLLFMILLHRFK